MCEREKRNSDKLNLVIALDEELTTMGAVSEFKFLRLATLQPSYQLCSRFKAPRWEVTSMCFHLAQPKLWNAWVLNGKKVQVMRTGFLLSVVVTSHFFLTRLLFHSVSQIQPVICHCSELQSTHLPWCLALCVTFAQ